MFFATFLLIFFVVWGILGITLPVTRRGIRIAAGTVARWGTRFKRADRIFAFTREHSARIRAYGPVVLIIIAGVLLTAWAGDAFLDLATMVHQNNAHLLDIDSQVHDWAIMGRSPQATTFFVMMTNIGGPAGCAIIATAAAIVLAIKRRWRWLLYLAVTSGGGALINMGLKHYFERARPDVLAMLRRANGYSFPSGHAMGSTVVFGALSYLAFRVVHRWRWKTAVLALGFTIVVAVALSRVYLGVHWLSDVAAGIGAGTIWVTSTTVAYETLRRARLLRALRRPLLPAAQGEG